MTRRGFLARLLRTLMAGTAATPMLRAAASAVEAGGLPDGSTGLAPAQWETLTAVQEHLLPSEAGIPGAREVHAARYLRLVLADKRLDPGEREIIRGGVSELDEICRALHAKSFPALETDQREAALRMLEKSPTGRRWLAEMLEFLMEALLGDPSHGGNPKGIGWKWLSINPGFPRPPVR